MSGVGLTADTLAAPRDLGRTGQAILRGTLIVNVIASTSNFHEALLPPSLSALQQYIGVLCWVVIIAAARLIRSAEAPRFGSDTWALVIFYVYAVASVLWTDMSAASVMKSAALAITSLGAFTLATRCRLQDVIYDFNLGLFVLNLASIAVVIVRPDIGIASGWSQVGNWQGVFESKQSLGVLGGMAMFFSGYLWLTRGASWLFALSFLAALACTVGSESRGGGGLALLACVCVFVAGRSRNVAKLLAFAPLGIMTIASVMTFYLYATGADAFQIGDSRIDFTERTYIWQHALSYLDQRPLLGFGINGFWTNGDIYIAFERAHGWVLDNFHSGYVAILTEFGLVGYAMFGICTMLFGVRLGQAIDSDEMERSRVVALIGFMALAYQIDVTETMFMRSTSSIATLILACAFNAALRFAPRRS